MKNSNHIEAFIQNKVKMGLVVLKKVVYFERPKLRSSQWVPGKL